MRLPYYCFPVDQHSLKTPKDHHINQGAGSLLCESPDPTLTCGAQLKPGKAYYYYYYYYYFYYYYYYFYYY